MPDLEWELDAVPVDYVADAISALAWSDGAAGQVYHLQHPQPLLLSELLARLSARGMRLETVSTEEWLTAIAGTSSDHPLLPLLPFFKQRWGLEGLTFPDRNVRGVRARPSCKFTMLALEALGVQCPDYDLLEQAWGMGLLGQATVE